MSNPIRRLQGLFCLAFMLAAAGAHAQSLPDFTGLVERNSPAVVNITASSSGTASNDDEAGSQGFGDDEEVPEIFKRLFPQPPEGHPAIPRVAGGSGFIISADGYVLTNHHVVSGADEVNVRLKDRREFIAKVIGSDPQSDIALLKIDATGLPAATLGKSSGLKPGQWVVAIGSPFGLEYSVTAGIVSATGRSLANDQRYVPFIQTDVAINRGNSGGPLINLDGEVVGINSQIFSNTGGSIGLSFAIPIEVARSVAEQLKSTGRVSRGQLGVQIQEVTRDIAQALDLPRIGGALVAIVNPGSPAEKAGIKVQDVIVAYNGVAIDHSSDLPPLVGNTSPGSKATVTVLRDGRELTLPVTPNELVGEQRLQASAPTPKAGAGASALGLDVRELTADERSQIELPKGGVVVEDVTSAEARRAGIQAGDVILKVGRRDVGSVAQFREAAKGAPAGQPIVLLVRRGDATTFLSIRPGPAAG
ncbi:MAG TPA: DegQ family serine endoprotease [Xanthomonadales bacterium]|nr:DegQ family serine endoprotease [Xanthomonadales bacterium]